MATNELLPFANGEDANVLPTAQWQALTDILENGFQSGIAKSEQVNRVLAQGAVASYVLGQLIVDQLNQNATLDETTLYQNIVKALQETAKDVCLPLSGGTMTGELIVNDCLTMGVNTIRRSDDSNRINLMGSNSWDGGARLSLYGKDDSISGGFDLTATNGTTFTALSGRPDGSLTWGYKDVLCVEWWQSGSNWYRKYSDGWIEQGGLASIPSSSLVKTLNTPFTSTNYMILGTSNNNTNVVNVTNNNRTTSTFEVDYVNANSGYLYWYACGY